MENKKKIEDLIFKTVGEINKELPENQQLIQSSDTIVFGKGGILDSLGLVNLVILLEENIADEFDVDIIIADEKAMSQKRSPFSTIGSLTNYIDILLINK